MCVSRSRHFSLYIFHRERVLKINQIERPRYKFTVCAHVCGLLAGNYSGNICTAAPRRPAFRPHPTILRGGGGGYLCLEREQPTCILHAATVRIWVCIVATFWWDATDFFYTVCLLFELKILTSVYNCFDTQKKTNKQTTDLLGDACNFCQSDLQAVARYGLDWALPILKNFSRFEQVLLQLQSCQRIIIASSYSSPWSSLAPVKVRMFCLPFARCLRFNSCAVKKSCYSSRRQKLKAGQEGWPNYILLATIFCTSTGWWSLKKLIHLGFDIYFGWDWGGGMGGTSVIQRTCRFLEQLYCLFHYVEIMNFTEFVT